MEARRLSRPAGCAVCAMNKEGQGWLPDLIPCKPLALFLGETGGEDETVYSRPFCGGAGNYLVALCRKAGWVGALTEQERTDAVGLPVRLLRKHRIGLGNILRCRPPRNKYPTGKVKTQAEQCCRQYDGFTWDDAKSRLVKVDFSDLRVVIPMGEHAFRLVSGQKKVGTKSGITTWQGSVLPHRYTSDDPSASPWGSPKVPWQFPARMLSWKPSAEKEPAWPVSLPARVWLVPTLHPAALMRDPTGWPNTVAFFERALHVVQDGWTPPVIRIIRLDTLKAVTTVLHALAERSCKLKQPVFSDIENDGSLIRCISFCLEPPTAYVLPLVHFDGTSYWNAAEGAVVGSCLRIFYGEALTGFQHGMHDVSYLEPCQDLHVKKWTADTCYLHALTYSELRHNLAFLQACFTNYPQHKTMVAWEAEDVK